MIGTFFKGLMTGGLSLWQGLSGPALWLALAAATFTSGVGLGHSWASDSADAKTLKVEREAAKRYSKAVDAGWADADRLRTELATQAGLNTTLKVRLKNVRIIASPAAAVACDQAAADVRLTVGAVSVWNNALAGRAVPAGACGADGGTDGACAAAAEATPDDAWENHAVNAAACREDRTRYRRLIEHLRKREREQR